MDTHQLTTFNPSDELAAELLAAFFDPDRTLCDLASTAGVSVQTLSMWIESPEVQAKILRADNTMTLRTRCIARGFLGQVFTLLAEIVLETKHVITRVPVHPGDTKAREGHRRNQETGRRASTMLLRLANLPYLTAIPPIAKAFEASNKLPRSSSAAAAQPAPTDHADKPRTPRSKTASAETPRPTSQFAPVFAAAPTNTPAASSTHPSHTSHTSPAADLNAGADPDPDENTPPDRFEEAIALAERFLAQHPEHQSNPPDTESTQQLDPSCTRPLDHSTTQPLPPPSQHQPPRSFTLRPPCPQRPPPKTSLALSASSPPSES